MRSKSYVFLLSIFSLIATIAPATNVLKANPVASSTPGGREPRASDPCWESTPKETKERLDQLRRLMAANGVRAYIITGSDAHGSEYTAEHDKRVQRISGFSGSYGDAVITDHKAALWTDSRYYSQAQDQLDCNWQLMKDGEENVPSISAWIGTQLKKGNKVGADPSILTYKEWTTLLSNLGPHGIEMKAIDENLVDLVWGAGQPPYPDGPIEVLPTQFTGETWQSKVSRVQESTEKLGGDLTVLNALDEAAWLFNMRSSEVAYTPVFRAYVLVPSQKSRLPVHLYLPEEKNSETVRSHLNDEKIHVVILPYDQIWLDLPKMAANVSKVILPEPIYLVRGGSYRLYTSVPSDKVKWAVSPVLILKSTKNEVEVMGMQASHVRDAVALCQLLALIEKEVPLGVHWDELLVSQRLSELRAAQNFSKGDSFKPIVAFGNHSAVPHYDPTKTTNVRITNHSVLLMDSGGQYLDGTTDVTRTVHLGTPTEFQVTVYTRLLQGCVNLASLNFPKRQPIGNLDVLLRAPLYQLGLNYGHGSTHGIGAYLAVHEGSEKVYHLNFFGSHEPGFYSEEEGFGMRLENIVQVVNATAKYDQEGKFLTFNTTTLVPYDRKLINTTEMTDSQIQWVNQYYNTIRDKVGQEMLRQGLNETYIWLLKNTEPLTKT